MQIGLIGGIGPAATDFYYRRLISTFAGQRPGLDLTIAHADTPTLLGHLASANAAAQVAIYLRLTQRLAAAGAGCVAVTSIAGHFCIEDFKLVSPLPVIDMIGSVGQAVERLGVRRVGILGTRTVMESRFYGGVTSAAVIPPSGAALDAVHLAYVEMASAGVATAAHRGVFEAASDDLMRNGAEAIMLGGTDLALVFRAGEAAFPVIDCAAIHADAIAAFAVAAGSER